MRYVITTVYNGQRKFLFNPGHHSCATDSVVDATSFDDIDDAAEAAGVERRSKRWRGFNWHEAIHPDDAKSFNNEIKIACECNGRLP